MLEVITQQQTTDVDFKWPKILRKEKVLSAKDADLSNQIPPEVHAAMTPIFYFSYDGEKTPGEIGIIKDYQPDYYSLRARSWQSYLESEITQTVIGKLAKWVVGSGLRLQAEPDELILPEDEVVGTDEVKKIEALFRLVANAPICDHSGNDNLHELAKSAYINAIVGGDVLCIIRTRNGVNTVQLIDGAHLSSFAAKAKNGNEVKYGVEVDKYGKHVAYHVRDVNGRTVRVAAYDPGGKFRMAFLIYGLKYRLSEVRGVPLISVVLETLKKLDRYKEAVVGSAEEVAKIPYFIRHKTNSTGENPLLKQIVQAQNIGVGPAKETEVVNGDTFATKVATTTKKMVFNMPTDSEIDTVSPHNSELNFKDFFTSNFEFVCSALQIPPEVAMSMYNSNYSASRAAIKDWEHSLKVDRKSFSDKFYQPYYKLFLTTQVLNGMVSLPLYIDAILQGDIIKCLAYQNARFIGANVPNIDPLKEVMAVRKMLGNDNIPLITHEDAAEILSTGDWNSFIKKYQKELEDSGMTAESSNIKSNSKSNSDEDGNNE